MTRTVDVRFNLLRNGAWAGYLLAPEGSAPVLRMNTTGDIKTALSGDFAAQADANWLTDEIEPVLYIDGTPHTLGVFLPATAREAENETTRSVHIEAYDRCWKVQDNYTESMYYIPAGTNYVSAVKMLLEAAGIAAVLATPTSLTTATARQDWGIGTSYLTIINQLLSEINYKPLWFNAEGVAVLEPAAMPTAANIRNILDSGDVRSLLLPQITRETDVYRAPNVFVCIVSSPDLSGPLVAKAENNNPQSPLSIQRRGRRIVQVVYVDNIASQAELQSYADRLLYDSMTQGETLVVSTGLLPGFGVNEITALHYGDLSALCRETAWTMELRSGGTMTHTLERVVYKIEE